MDYLVAGDTALIQRCRAMHPPVNPSHSALRSTDPNGRTAAKVAATILLVASTAWTALGQNSVRQTTNYYPVTGATLPEIRRSMNENRPWKDRQSIDGLTTWRVDWRFTVSPSANGCYCHTFTTTTTIAITLPRWTAPTNASEQVKAAWTRYYSALARHEAGHAQLGHGAAAELQRKSRDFGTRPDCESLKSSITAACEQVVQDFRRRDKEYDERTRNGARDGASFPGEGRRNRGPSRQPIP